MRSRLLRSLLTLFVLTTVMFVPAGASAESHLFTETVGFATKTGYRGVFTWQATEPVLAFVRYGTSPDNLDEITIALPGAPDTAGMAIAEGLTIGQRYYFQVVDDLTGEASEIKSFVASNAYNAWNGSVYTLDLLVQLDSESLPPGIPSDQALENISAGVNIFAERLFDATDGFARLGTVLVTDTELDYGVNIPFLPPGCFTGLTNAADVLVQTTIPFDSHTLSGWSIEDPCISFYVGRLGQLVFPWGGGNIFVSAAEDLHFGYVATHEMMHYAFNAPDLYADGGQEGRNSGCWNLEWDGSLMHNTGGWEDDHWELTELDRNADLTPCDHQHDSKYTWPELRTRYTNVPERPNGPIENIFDTQARGNPDGGALDIRILDRSPGASTLTQYVPVDGGITSTPCVEPGQTIHIDAPYDSFDGLPEHDVISLAISEPFNLGPDKVVFRLKMASLRSIPPGSTYPVVFKDGSGADRWARMAVNGAGQVSFSHGTGTNPNQITQAGQPAHPSSSYTPDGDIRIVVNRSDIGLTPGQSLSSMLVRIRMDTPTGGFFSPDNMPDSRVPSGSYTSIGSENCSGNGPPTAGDDLAVTLEDQAARIFVLVNDTDPDGDTLTITKASTPANGTTTVDVDSVIYTPNQDFNGNDSFTYSVNDGRGGTAQATVTVQVTPVPDGVVAFDDQATAPNAQAISIPVLRNDFEPDGEDLTIASVADPAGGAASISGSSLIYRSDAGFSGTDVFEYTVTDGVSSDTASVTVRVLPPGADNPCELPGVKIADDPAGDHTGPGTFDLRSAFFAGPSTTGVVTVTLNLAASIDPPPANGAWRVRFTDGAVVRYLVMETTEAFGPPRFRFGTVNGTSLIDGGPASGSVSGNTITISVGSDKIGSPKGGGSYSPVFAQTQQFVGTTGAGGYVQTDVTSSRSYEIPTCVEPHFNTPPVASDDAVTTDEDTAVSIDVLANDTDPEGDALTITAVGDGLKGDVALNGDGSITYTPNANVNGSDTFAYTITDGEYSVSAMVAVTIVSVNDPPVAFDDSVTVAKNRSAVLAVLANDKDVEQDTLTVDSATAPSQGSVVINSDGTVTYTPHPWAKGMDSFSYTVADGKGSFSTGMVFITISKDKKDPAAT